MSCSTKPLTSQGAPRYDVFISHKSADLTAAREIYFALDEAGCRPFLAHVCPSAGPSTSRAAAEPAAPAQTPEAVAPVAPPVSTAPAPAPPATTAESAPPAAAAAEPAQSEEHEKAARLARIIVSDIILYNQEEFDAAVRAGNVLEALGPQLAEGHALFAGRVDPSVADAQEFLSQELLRIARSKGMNS